MSFSTDTGKQIKEFNRRLKQIGDIGIPRAAAGTLDNMAFESRKISTRIFEGKHIIRSNWTQRGMRFEKTKKGIPIRQMESRSGNVREYAGILETGGTVQAENKYLPIPALGARVSKSKRKRIARRFRMDRLDNVRRMPKVGGSPTRRFAAMLNIGRKEKFFGPFLVTKEEAGSDMPRGIFNLSGHGRGRRGGGKITILRKLQPSVLLPGNPFIAPAGRRIGGRMDRFYIKQAKRVLKKYGRDIR